MSKSLPDRIREYACAGLELTLTDLESGNSNRSLSNDELQTWHDKVSQYGVSQWFLTSDQVEGYQKRIRDLII